MHCPVSCSEQFAAAEVPRTFQIIVSLMALTQNSDVGVASALPPDVRRWLCPADSGQIYSGLCPWFRALPRGFKGPKAAPGA